MTNMQKKLCSYIVKVNRVAILLVTVASILGANIKSEPKDLTINGDLKLLDGRQISLRMVGDSPCHEVSLRSMAHTYLWDRTYCTDFGMLWFEPFFIPVKAGNYEVDLDRNGYPEVAIAVWDGGNHPELGKALIFTVYDRKLILYGKRKYHIESEASLLP